jgi:transposase
MDIVHPSCAGLDVHKKTVITCVRRINPDNGAVSCEVRTFGTTTADLLALADWLAARSVGKVAMESTGVYWKPIYNLLEGSFQVILVNAHRLKHVPGRKTDVKDAEWIAQLLQYGLLSPSFIPALEIRQLRDLTRQRAQIIGDHTAVANRIQKVLEDANIKLASVASDVLGVSGRAMIRAIIGGRTDPGELAELAKRRLRGKIPQLKEALHGRVTDHHRFLLQALMDQLEFLEGLIARLDARIEEAMVPLSEPAGRLQAIPGVGEQAAEVIMAELGPDMEQFPTDGHLSSWAGLCPGNDQTAGKQRNGKTTKGNQWLRTTLVQVAWAASRTKDTIFSACYKRWAGRMGRKKALVAVAHKILVVIYNLLKKRTDYRENWKPALAV